MHAQCHLPGLRPPAPPGVALQVRHRCPCTDRAVCGELSDRVAELAAAGKLPPFAPEGRTFSPEDYSIERWPAPRERPAAWYR